MTENKNEKTSDLTPMYNSEELENSPVQIDLSMDTNRTLFDKSVDAPPSIPPPNIHPASKEIVSSDFWRQFQNHKTMPRTVDFIYKIQNGFFHSANIFQAALDFCLAPSLNQDIACNSEYLGKSLQKEWGINDSSILLSSHLEGLLTDIKKDDLLQKIYHFIIDKMDRDPAHDIYHILRVAWWGLQIGAQTGQLNKNHIIAAALLHDVVNIPKGARDASEASHTSSMVAKYFLSDIGFDSPDNIEIISKAIEEHSYSRRLTPTSTLSDVLQDADRLDALGTTGIIRLFLVGHQMGASAWNPKDPWATSRQLDDKKFTLDHFFIKLLNLEKKMRTNYGRSEAQKRIVTMNNFLKCLRIELIDF